MNYNNIIRIERNVCAIAYIVASVVLIGCCVQIDTMAYAFQTISTTIRPTTAVLSTSATTTTTRYLYRTIQRNIQHQHVPLHSSESDDTDRTITPLQMELSNDDDAKEQLFTPTTAVAATIGTVNERLLAELREATALEKAGVRGGKTTAGSNNKFIAAASFFQSTKTDEERRAAIAEAKNLNGVDPISTFFGAIFAIACAIGLWYITQSLASYFALHPSDSDIYFVERVTLLSRNIIMGLSALASGFFGVTGIGILLLAIRVGYGVVTGELDPTPITPSTINKADKMTDNAKVDMSNVWDMMMNKSPKKGQR